MAVMLSNEEFMPDLKLDPRFNNVGCWIANNKTYYSKIAAILDMPLGDRDLRWYFHENEFSKVNWYNEPTESLDQLYEERARQLRDTYDYLVLCFSGGSDSYQVLQSFRRANIKIDEILMFGSFKTDKTKDPISKDSSFKNVEIYHIAEPIVAEVMKEMPNLKVTYFDYVDSLIKSHEDDVNTDWIKLNGSNRLTANSIVMENLHHHNVDDQRRKKNVAYIWGVDKPRILKKDDKWYIYFQDNVISGTPGQDGKEERIIDELFFWSPFSNKMLAKQAHSFKRFIESDPARNDFFSTFSIKNFPTEQYYELVKPAIYPSTHRPGLWQTNKSKPLFTEKDWWFYDDTSKAYHRWKDGIDQVSSVIDPYWLNKGVITNGLVGCTSKFYQFA
jgi:hypothetical protein